MTAQTWLAAFDEPVPASGLRNPLAAALAAFVVRYCEDIATFIEARRQGEQELLVLDVRTGAPQAPAYPIRHIERVGILFVREDTLPFVVMLRDDFPDTEHQQLVPEGHPAVICVDDRPWPEARLTWTPAELIERILSWFRRAARGELHDARQPLDPVFMGSQLGFVVARSILAADAAEDLIAEHDPEQATILRVKRLADVGEIRNGMGPLCLVAYRVPPERMTRLRFAPVNLGGVAAMLAARGIDLYADLIERFTKWLAEGQPAAWRLNARFAIIIEMPVVSPRGEQQEGLDLRAFVSPQSAGDIAVALGVALKPQAKDEGSRVGYVRMIAPAGIDRPAVHAIEMQSAELHLEFERELATRLAGRSVPDTRKAVLVGAGALGSHLADCLVREGRFRWTVIDDDRVLPHNLARHVARNDQVIRPKAKVLADCLNTRLAGAGALAESMPANLFADGEQGATVAASLNAADLVIDATASVLAGRALSDHEAQARRLSVFFNPSGEATVLLAEPAGRALTLRDLEAQYLGLVLRTGRLADHLGKDAETVAYTGACRAITNRIPQSRVSVLAGLAASGVSRAADGTKAVISIWSLASSGEVTLDSAKPEPVSRYRAFDWLITIDAGVAARTRAMRDARLPAETGGVLFGLVDIPAKSIHLVDASPAPPGSEERPDGFMRGTRGLEDLMESVRRRTAGQVRHVGEWHSHPPRASAHPSPVDARQIDWLAALMGMDSMPALMLIAAHEEMGVIFAHQRAEPLPPERVS
jgi:hypothetical protein